LAATEPTNPSLRNDLAHCETNAAAALRTLGRLLASQACCDRAIAIREELVKGDLKHESYAQGLAESLMRSGTAKEAAVWRRAAALDASHPPGGHSAIFRACCHGGLAGLAGKVGSGVSAAEGAVEAEQAMAILRRAVADGYGDVALLRAEPGPGPLRGRDDFRLLMTDMAFPFEPFALSP
jgi:hypothetical protein